MYVCMYVEYKAILEQTVWLLANYQRALLRLCMPKSF